MCVHYIIYTVQLCTIFELKCCKHLQIIRCTFGFYAFALQQNNEKSEFSVQRECERGKIKNSTGFIHCLPIKHWDFQLMIAVSISVFICFICALRKNASWKLGERDRTCRKRQVKTRKTERHC